ncbi:MAG: transcription-repair coupling factor, partial [Clostridia bacterium]|nr:transcription-repair coupling factor [Clostridia bacterium]
MKILDDILLKDPDYAELLKSVKSERPAICTGLSLIHKAAVVAAVSAHTGKKAVIITHDEGQASLLADDINSLGLNCLHFPLRDYCIGELSGYSKEYEHKRTDTLSRLLDGDFDLLTLSVDAAISITMPPEILQKNRFSLKSGESISTEQLTSRLIDAGYVRDEICEAKGRFAIRGGIFDIFPVNDSMPYRIEFWGDEIDLISEFDVETQRRTQNLEKIEISPASEVLYNNKELSKKLTDYLESDKKLTDKQKLRLNADINSLENDISILPDRYLQFLYGNSTVFDYLKDVTLFLSEGSALFERFKSMEIQQSEDIKVYLEEGFLSQKTAKLWTYKTDFIEEIKNAFILENFPHSGYELPVKEIINFNLKRSTAWSGDFQVLIEDISYNLSKKGKVVILAGEIKAAKVLERELRDKGIPVIFSENRDVAFDGVTVCCGGLSGGFEIPSCRFLLITHRHIASDSKRKRAKYKSGKEIGSIEELRRGDYVVHESHGIGIFEGINRITNSGITKDYIKIKYAGTDILYVPVTQLNLVSKYIGAPAGEGNIRLNRLGGSDWQKTRTRVKAAVKDMAKQLTALYAKRMSVKGYAFSADTDLQNDFERRFEYEETEDQLKCINEIKSDMERAVPMDRLLCGDVGFGKTEVALRAAFKCVSEGKQCAILVPTTILAMQHYNTIVRRFGDMPVNIAMLSRFVPEKQQKKNIAGIKSGRIDLVVGTHRLISKDITFKNIGLVIIDEEQRFGVAQKERLKELYPFVDILTLSATPIPRTLNMAMSGLRDMSSIDEAPGDRHPVQTYVLEYNMGVIADAINKEIRRGGQIYYLHNRVETIDRCAGKLKKMLPDIRIGVAHGKMTEEQLSEVWRQLIEQEIDLLVCTTIIETGVDIPNVNTLIIENADRMGLAQLHQLRGRVGRSPRRAYAYFCFERNRMLSDVAARRLEAIREFTEFGSGFKIALRDLEIRGAGSILGGEQHGNMEAVGYDMYLKLLSAAVNEENGAKSEDDIPCTVDLNISAHIPESYIESLPARLGIYKRIADIKSDSDVEDVIDELCDR